jgi:hypothetical protein
VSELDLQPWSASVGQAGQATPIICRKRELVKLVKVEPIGQSAVILAGVQAFKISFSNFSVADSAR